MIVSKIRKRQVDYTWPGFVDALSSLLMVIIFVLMIFVLSQFFLSQKMSGQDEALINLRNSLAELGELLSLERDTTTELTSQSKILELQNEIDDKIQNTLLLQNNINNLNKRIDSSQLELNQKNDEISASQKEINTLISASLKLRNKLSQLQTLLSAYKAKDKKEKVKTINVGKGLNSALARRVEELQKLIRSSFWTWF